MQNARTASRWRFLVSPRWLAWHAFAVVAFFGMLALGDWQYHRAISGNGLSWAYTFEWPLFAVMGAFFWAKTIRDEFRIRSGRTTAPGWHPAGPGRSGPAGTADLSDVGVLLPGRVTVGGDEPEDPELASYNAYLAVLNDRAEARGG